MSLPIYRKARLHYSHNHSPYSLIAYVFMFATLSALFNFTALVNFQWMLLVTYVVSKLLGVLLQLSLLPDSSPFSCHTHHHLSLFTHHCLRQLLQFTSIMPPAPCLIAQLSSTTLGCTSGYCLLSISLCLYLPYSAASRTPSSLNYPFPTRQLYCSITFTCCIFLFHLFSASRPALILGELSLLTLSFATLSNSASSHLSPYLPSPLPSPSPSISASGFWSKSAQPLLLHFYACYVCVHGMVLVVHGDGHVCGVLP